MRRLKILALFRLVIRRSPQISTVLCRLGLGAVLGVSVAGLGLAQQGPGERPAPRVSFKGGAAGPGVVPGDAELLPSLPEAAAAAPRKPVAAAVAPLPPDIPPLGLPSDGEAAPSFPDLPDLPQSSLLPQLPADDRPASGGDRQIPFGPSEDGDGAAPVDEGAAGVRPPAPPPAPAVSEPPFPIWHENPKTARALAEEQRRCLLLVFSGAQGEAGGTSKQLSDEVFSSPAFNEFALGHLVICGLFYAKSSSLDLSHPALIARADAMAAFKKAFKVRGFPCVILLGPDGKEINRWSGYVGGRGAAYREKIRQAVEGHEAVLFESERRRERLAAKGYRTWMSAQGSPLFALLIEYDAHTALFRDEAGADRKVALKQLALPDREIITRQRLGKPMPERVVPAATAETTLR